jgi:putative transposase
MNCTHQTQHRSVRLETHDYSSPGACFVTICTQMRGANWFGEVPRDGMVLNDAGRMIQSELKRLTTRFSRLELDAYVIMPDHVHITFVLQEIAHDESNPQNRRGEPNVRPITDRAPHGHDESTNAPHLQRDVQSYENPRGTQTGSVGHVVQLFKTFTTQEYIKGIRGLGWRPFEKRFWQRDYYERILRNDAELEQKRGYIMGNPARWLEKWGSA